VRNVLSPFPEKQNASLSVPAAAFRLPREAKCFSQRASSGISPSERSKLLLSARQQRHFTFREKQIASLSAPTLNLRRKIAVRTRQQLVACAETLEAHARNGDLKPILF
jgi:hypothetical protein